MHDLVEKIEDLDDFFDSPSITRPHSPAASAFPRPRIPASTPTAAGYPEPLARSPPYDSTPPHSKVPRRDTSSNSTSSGSTARPARHRPSPAPTPAHDPHVMSPSAFAGFTTPPPPAPQDHYSSPPPMHGPTPRQAQHHPQRSTPRANGNPPPRANRPRLPRSSTSPVPQRTPPSRNAQPAGAGADTTSAALGQALAEPMSDDDLTSGRVQSPSFNSGYGAGHTHALIGPSGSGVGAGARASPGTPHDPYGTIRPGSSRGLAGPGSAERERDKERDKERVVPKFSAVRNSFKRVIGGAAAGVVPPVPRVPENERT